MDCKRVNNSEIVTVKYLEILMGVGKAIELVEYLGITMVF